MENGPGGFAFELQRQRWVRERREAGVNGASRHAGGTRSFLEVTV
ncbi:hypothetical protein [Paenibacillus sp. MCAF9]